jgi:hypothetical protein
VVLPVTFGTRENYHTEFLKFEVATFDSSYPAILEFLQDCEAFDFLAREGCGFLLDGGASEGLRGAEEEVNHGASPYSAEPKQEVHSIL